MKTISIFSLFKWSLILGVIGTIITYSIYYSLDFYAKKHPMYYLNCENDSEFDVVFYLEDLTYSENLIKYYSKLDSGQREQVKFPVNGLKKGSQVYVLDYTKDSTLARFYCNKNTSQDPIYGYVVRRTLVKKFKK
jgi:hypothetical protein